MSITVTIIMMMVRMHVSLVLFMFSMISSTLMLPVLNVLYIDYLNTY